MTAGKGGNMDKFTSFDVIMRDRYGRPFGIGSMVEYQSDLAKGPKRLISTVCEVTLKEDGNIMVKVIGRKSRPLPISKIRVVKLNESESILHSEFARRGVFVSPDELTKMVSMLSLSTSGGIADKDRTESELADRESDETESMVLGSSWSDEEVMLG